MSTEVHEEIIEAPPADVWGFMVDPAALSAWFGADAWLEPEPRGVVRFRFAGGVERRSGPMTSLDHDAVFQALADPTRRTLLRALSASGPSTLAELSSGVPVSRQAVSKHLSLLQDAGLVVGRGEVRGRRYELTPAPLADALGWMVDVGAGWDDRLARLKRQVEGRRR